jgi:ABC-type multidrug transport system ATPase subunit/ABC-type multidrug transport system permease subunit
MLLLRRSQATARVVANDTLLEERTSEFTNLLNAENVSNIIPANIQKLSVELSVALQALIQPNTSATTTTTTSTEQQQPTTTTTNTSSSSTQETIRRVGVLFQKFLDAIDHAEDMANEQANQAQIERDQASEMADRVASTAEHSAAVSLLKHLLERGVEEHFELLKTHMFGDRYVGFTVTLKNVEILSLTTTTPPTTNTKAVIGGGGEGQRRGGGGGAGLKYDTILTHARKCLHLSTIKSYFENCCNKKPNTTTTTSTKSSPLPSSIMKISGVIKPGRLLFLAGEQRAGKSTLLKVIAGLARSTKFQKVSGELRFNGHPLWKDESSWQESLYPINNFVLFLPRQDSHLQTLTVRETLEFAWKMRAKDTTFLRAQYAKDPDLVFDHYRARVDIALALVGLLDVQDHFISTLSGGETRLLSLAESLVSNSKVMLLEEIGFGLDSASDYKVVRVLRMFAKFTLRTVVIAQVDISSDVLGLFDDVWLLRGGQILYRGPREELEQYVVQACGRERLYNEEDPISFILTAIRDVQVSNELLKIWEESPLKQTEMMILNDENPIYPKLSAEQFMLDLPRYRIEWFGRTWALIQRQFLLISRTPDLAKARLVEFSLISLLTGLLFFQIELSDSFLKTQVLSYVLIQSSSLPRTWFMVLVGEKNVLVKHMKLDYFSSSNAFFSDLFVYAIFNSVESFFYSLLMYLLVGLSWGTNGSSYFIFFFLLVSYNATLFCIVRMVSSFILGGAEQADMANVWLAFIFGAVLYLFSGNPITPNEFPVWAGWIFWLIPSSWMLRALLINEFTSEPYTCTNPGCPNNAQGQCIINCVNASSPSCVPLNYNCGKYFLLARQQPDDRIWIGACFGFLFMFMLICSFVDYYGIKLAMKSELFKPIVVKQVQQKVQQQQQQQQPQPQIKSPSDQHQQQQSPSDPSINDPILNFPPPPIILDKPVPELPKLSIIDQQPLLQPDQQQQQPDLESQHNSVTTTTTTTSITPIPPTTYCFEHISLSVEVPIFTNNNNNNTNNDPSNLFARSVGIPPGNNSGNTNNNNTNDRRSSTKLELLKNIKGFLKSNEFTAIIGPSGAGKSTLLSVLCRRRKCSTGDFYLNSKYLAPNSNIVFGFVEQTPLLPEKSTIVELLKFNLVLRNRERIHHHHHQQQQSNNTNIVLSDDDDTIIQNILKDFDLTSHSYSLAQSLPLEDKKRVAVACEIVANSPVVLLDEPSTGLLLQTTLELLTTLRDIARSRGVIIAASVHQPSRAVFAKFDRIILLKRGGEIAFAGKNEDVIKFFSSFPSKGAILTPGESEEGINPATLMLRVLAENENVAVAYYQSSSLYSRNEGELKSLIVGDSSSSSNTSTKKSSEQQPTTKISSNNTATHNKKPHYGEISSTRIFRIILYRALLATWRNPILFYAELGSVFLTSLLIGLLLRNSSEYTSASQVQNRVLSIAAFISQGTRLFAIHTARGWIRRRPLFLKETRGLKLYKSWVHGLTGLIAEIPFVCLMFLLSCTMFYWPSQIPPILYSDQAILSYGWLIWAGMTYSLCVAGIASAAATYFHRTAIICIIFTLAASSLFSGASLPGQSIPQYLLGLYYFFPLRWFMEAVITVEFQFNTQVFCNPSGILTKYPIPPSTGGLFNNHTIRTICPGPNHIPAQILDPSSNVSWCCDLVGSLPINVSGYALYGQQYYGFDNNPFVEPKWGGSPNGYLFGRRFFDILYLCCFVLVCGLLVIGNVSWFGN